MLKRRLFLLLAVLLPLLGFAQAKSVPYFSQIGGTSKLDADWTVYNVNGDEKLGSTMPRQVIIAVFLP